MEIKIKFDILNDMLNNIVEIKNDYDSFKKEIEEASLKFKEIMDDVQNLIIIFIIGDGFI
jgi:hypothetical protein